MPGAAAPIPPRTVVFDLDGTLADTGADLVAAANACFAEQGLGRPLDPVADRATAMRGGAAMLRLGLERTRGAWTEAEVSAQYDPLLAHYAEHIADETRLFDGAAEAVAEMRADGWRTAICTNKPERLAEALMAALGARDLFDALVGADTLPTRKPDPAPYRASVERAGGDPARSLLIGDTETDRDTARAAGVPCVLVTFGPEGPAIARLEPEAMLERFADLAAVAGRLVPEVAELVP